MSVLFLVCMWADCVAGQSLPTNGIWCILFEHSSVCRVRKARSGGICVPICAKNKRNKDLWPQVQMQQVEQAQFKYTKQKTYRIWRQARVKTSHQPNHRQTNLTKSTIVKFSEWSPPKNTKRKPRKGNHKDPWVTSWTDKIRGHLGLYTQAGLTRHR